MKDVLETKLARFEELERAMVDPATLSNQGKMATIAREHGELVRIATKYRSFKNLNQQIVEAKEMIAGKDLEMRELAEMEMPQLKADREQVWNELLELTIGGEEATRSKCVMEIRAGTGGEEAGLFAKDLYNMYKHHCEAKGWKMEVLDMSSTEIGGLKEIQLAITGNCCFRELAYESGGHRVQRVPETEAKGRIHTSAATVAVLPEPEDVEIDLKPEDYRLDKFCASGPGGQHVNKTESAVRLTHLETGIVVQCQDEKSQHKNLAKALRVLKARLYDAKLEEENKKRADQRKSLVGSGDRSQRIRTFNFPENRVTDHRINFTVYKLDQILAGNLQILTDALIDYDREQLRGSMTMDE